MNIVPIVIYNIVEILAECILNYYEENNHCYFERFGNSCRMHLIVHYFGENNHS